MAAMASMSGKIVYLTLALGLLESNLLCVSRSSIQVPRRLNLEVLANVYFCRYCRNALFAKKFHATSVYVSEYNSIRTYVTFRIHSTLAICEFDTLLSLFMYSCCY